MPHPLVSVAIPVYNLEEYVAETLESVKNQTFEDFEVIIVDDGSTDRSAETIKPHLSDARFRYIRQENKGLSGARNTALADAKCRWLAFLDADDIWLPHYLECQIRLLESDPNANLAYSQVIRFRADGYEEIAPKTSEMREGDITAWLYDGNRLTGSATVVKTEDLRSIGGYDETLKRCEDYDVWLRLAQRGIHAKAWREPLMRYRLRDNSLSRHRELHLQTRIQVLEQALAGESRPSLVNILSGNIRRTEGELAICRASRMAKAGEESVEKLLWKAWQCEMWNLKRLAVALIYKSSTLTHIPFGRNLILKKLRVKNMLDAPL